MNSNEMHSSIGLSRPERIGLLAAIILGGLLEIFTRIGYGMLSELGAQWISLLGLSISCGAVVVMMIRSVKPFWDPISEAYAATDLVVARAGAMTVSELSAWGLPSVLIPLPSAAADHQTQNALALERAGSAVHLPDSSLGSSDLSRMVTDLLTDRERLAAMSRVAIERSQPHAAERIARQLLTLAD